jgi:hypothetical protein
VTSIARIYIDEIRRRLDETVVPLFAPDTPVEVGAIGSFDDGQFIVRGHMRERGADVEVVSGPPTPVWTFSSTGQVEISPAVEIGPPGAGAFSATLHFAGKQGVIASFQRVVETRTVDSDDFDRIIWELFLAGKLRQDRLVVWSVRRAEQGTVVVAAERGAHIELTAPMVSALTIEGISAGVSFGKSRGVGYSVSHAALTASVRLKRITPSNTVPVEDVRRFDPAEQDRHRRQAVRDVSIDEVLAP